MPMPRKWPRGFYCYTFSYPSGEPYYVGIGKGSRGSLASGRNPWAQRIRDKIRRDGGEVLVTLEEFETREAAAAREIELIAEHGRRDRGNGCLVNLTAGGEGQSGKIYTAEERARISQARKGMKMSPEARANMSASLIGNKNRLGIPHSDEIKAKISAASKGRKFSDEVRAARKAACNTDEARARLKKTSQDAWDSGKIKFSSEEMRRRSLMRKVFQK